ncbi:MAG: MotA/TolQ/ExbB proton channel family protein [Bdellovibrionales bacterium]|nr:MotA/TolQ/ExbB proton channel family protein [Bdellovibrionales bacterium]
MLLLLAGLSVWSVAIVVDRRRAFSAGPAKAELDEAREKIRAEDQASLRAWVKGKSSPAAIVVQAALEIEGADPLRVDRGVRAALHGERARYEKGLNVLATLGSNAPFIGLFGTVLGVIRAFAALGESQVNMNTVMAGISGALIATAAGLFVAIPAVVAYNVYSQRLRTLFGDCESLRDLYLARFSGDATRGR